MPSTVHILYDTCRPSNLNWNSYIINYWSFLFSCFLWGNAATALFLFICVLDEKLAPCSVQMGMCFIPDRERLRKKHEYL